jgi:hypothetical protein
MRLVLAPFQIFRFYPLALAIVIGVIVVDVGGAALWPSPGNTVETEATPYFEILEVLIISKRLPFEMVHLDLPGVFAVFLIVMGWPLVVLPPIAMAVPPWVWLVALAFFAYIGFSIDVVRKADTARTRDVPHEAAIHQAVYEIGEASKRLLSSVALIDISEPSANLLWEVEELTLRTKTPCVFIGEHDRVAPLGDDGVRSNAELSFPQLALLLGEHEVLAYTTDRAGQRRFARALRGKLQEVTKAVPYGAVP